MIMSLNAEHTSINQPAPMIPSESRIPIGRIVVNSIDKLCRISNFTTWCSGKQCSAADIVLDDDSDDEGWREVDVKWHVCVKWGVYVRWVICVRWVEIFEWSGLRCLCEVKWVEVFVWSVLRCLCEEVKWGVCVKRWGEVMCLWDDVQMMSLVNYYEV